MRMFRPGRPVDDREAPPAALAAPVAAASIAVFVAAPWLDQRLVWCEWVGLAAALLLIRHVRGWRGEVWTLLAATLALAIAFHWTPAVLAYAMNAGPAAGLLVAAPILLWDAVRLALPFWFAARILPDPLAAWLPAGLLAAAAEGIVPAVFPWKLGYAQVAWLPLVQAADLFGAEVTTLVLFAHAGVLVWLVDLAARAARSCRAGTRPALDCPWPCRLALAACGLNVAYGYGAIAYWDWRITAARTLTVALVQANPDDEDGVDALRALTRRCTEAAGAPGLACWPECSGGSYDERLDSLADADRVAAMSRPPRPGMRPLAGAACPLLFGGTIYSGHPDKPRALHQSAILLDTTATILGTYCKRHLMPFGEYVPGSDLVPDLARHFTLQQEFTPGTDVRVLGLDHGIRLGVMLCYEDMIPDAARSLARRSATVFVSLINGSAFTAPLTLSQHRLLAQLRTVECRRSLVRCAATGETCVIAPTGAIRAALPLQTRGVLVGEVPMLEATTPACLLGPLFPPACGIAAGAFAYRTRRRLPSAGPVVPPP